MEMKGRMEFERGMGMRMRGYNFMRRNDMGMRTRGNGMGEGAMRGGRGSSGRGMPGWRQLPQWETTLTRQCNDGMDAGNISRKADNGTRISEGRNGRDREPWRNGTRHERT